MCHLHLSLAAALAAIRADDQPQAATSSTCRATLIKEPAFPFPPPFLLSLLYLLSLFFLFPLFSL